MELTKKALRQSAMTRRKELSKAEFKQLNGALLAEFTTYDFTGVRTVHIFLPIESKREPDTFRLIEWLQHEHSEIRILVPKADFTTALMTHHEYLGTGDLKKNLYDILEPDQGALHDGEIDLVFVPLLAVDRRGYRVGYGKGFYDRFLTGRNCRKVGISLFAPVEAISDVHELDVCLDACLTPQGLITF
ncbi:5-formyltetrahydrofolate cyclo-ligase [Pedobacter sp. SYP-B3415]|uniref:5-formyltetrahydrofolate cyclo-ligase n=1 Tax=Pedobacter sp. SYP-B3415 TaxID=2496641 RepID=UPI00101B6029|nr:5-formyltetrahydrofolate cyclo-ligase [Pedobacter sp. SYP-B3415]